jgi:Holliday junction resolvase-like predicted endonuclease
LESVFETLQVLGYKVLLKNYECNIGEVDFVAKKNGKLFFVGANRPRLKVQLVSTYYMKRYGIKDAQSEEIIL